MKRFVVISYQFSLELLLGLLILFLFFIRSKEMPPIYIAMTLSLSSLILFSLLLFKFKANGKWLYFITIVPLLVLVGMYASIPTFSLGLLTLLIYWRGVSLFNEGSGYSEGTLLFFSFLIGVIALIYASASHYPFRAQIAGLLFAQILMVFGGGFVRKWWAVYDDKLSFAKFFLIVLVSVSIIGTAATLLMKPIQYLFFGILQSIAMLFANLVTPILMLLRLFNIGDLDSDGSAGVMEGISEYADSSKEQSFFLSEFIILAGILLVFAYIVYRMIKRKTNPLSDKHFLHGSEISDHRLYSEKQPFFRRRVKPPEDFIRREVFELEKYANKLNHGRRYFETIEDWWQRIGITDFGHVITIYEKIRYGSGQSSSEERNLISAEIRKIKHQIKDRSKGSKNHE